MPFLASGGGREQPEQIIVCGGCANIPGVAEVIGSRVGIPTEIGNPLGDMKLSSRARSAKKASAWARPLSMTSFSRAKSRVAVPCDSLLWPMSPTMRWRSAIRSMICRSTSDSASRRFSRFIGLR